MRIGALVAMLCLGLASSVARAATCNRPDLKETMPPDGAGGIPINASLFARYATGAEYLGEQIVLEQVSSGQTEVFSGPGSPSPNWDAVDGLLSITPGAPLSAGELYRVSWPGLRGFGTASKGLSKTIEFTAGSIEDLEPPLFDGIGVVDWDVERATDPCTDAQEERYVFELEVPDASDDGGRDSLMLLVFKTRGPGVEQPERALLTRLPAAGKRVRITQTIDDGVGEICFAGLVQDLTGKPSGGANRERCVETVEPPFFYGCGLAGGAPRPCWAALAAVVGLAWLRRRERMRCADRS
jgi:hypothetical protein